ncbi:hypothetical protein JXA84_08475 [candidate division WOR-3 bacterium]|nr:hypothetical protein [candidate division WOR-3 bacterium]
MHRRLTISSNKKIFSVILFAILACSVRAPSKRLDRARQLYYDGFYDRAKVVLDSSISFDHLSDDERLAGLVLSADIDIKRGEYASSSAVLEEIYSSRMDFKDTVVMRYQQIIDKLAYEGRFSEEIYFSKKLFLIDQNAVRKEILPELTRSFLMSADTANAMNTLLRSLLFEENSLNACMTLSDIYKNRKMYEVAVSWLDSAIIKPDADKIQIMQDKADILVEMSKELIRQKRQGEALNYLAEASYLTQGSTSAEAAWLAGSLYVASENYQKGRIFLERVLELERSSITREKAIKMLQMI